VNKLWLCYYKAEFGGRVAKSETEVRTSWKDRQGKQLLLFVKGKVWISKVCLNMIFCQFHLSLINCSSKPQGSYKFHRETKTFVTLTGYMLLKYNNSFQIPNLITTIILDNCNL
jgi:hypothetical protein